jgi:hypothetical protein
MLKARSESLRVELRIFSPCDPVRFISARLSAPVGALRVLNPDSPRRFIYGGTEMTDDVTFAEYGIQDGDTILALPLEENDNRTDRDTWVRLSRDQTAFSDSVRWIQDPNMCREAARLRDLRNMKMDRRSSTFWRMCRPFLQSEKEKSEYDMSTITYDGLKSRDSPCTEALPIFWNPRGQRK